MYDYIWHALAFHDVPLDGSRFSDNVLIVQSDETLTFSSGLGFRSSLYRRTRENMYITYLVLLYCINSFKIYRIFFSRSGSSVSGTIIRFLAHFWHNVLYKPSFCSQKVLNNIIPLKRSSDLILKLYKIFVQYISYYRSFGPKSDGCHSITPLNGISSRNLIQRIIPKG